MISTEQLSLHVHGNVIVSDSIDKLIGELVGHGISILSLQCHVHYRWLARAHLQLAIHAPIQAAHAGITA